MIKAYQQAGEGLAEVAADQVATALWIDLLQPTAEEVAMVAALGLTVPPLSEMEEIEISNRLYHDDGADYMTLVLPGQDVQGEQTAGPVTFILSQDRLITVRHHAPRPFETFPQRADRSGLGCQTADRLFLGLLQEIVGRLADHLEGVGRALDGVARQIYRPGPRGHQPQALQEALTRVGAEGERLGRVRLALLTLGRALNYAAPALARRPEGAELDAALKAELRDVDALEVHAEFLHSRVALASDATLGSIDLAQNTTVRIVSVVSVLFLPPTLIASVYGMNFAHMPELGWRWGYPFSLGLMALSVALPFWYFRRKGWLK